MDAVSSPIVILGGGASGLAAASMAVRMGQRVLLAEREAYCGGQYRLAGSRSLRGFASCQPVTDIQSGKGASSEAPFEDWMQSVLSCPEVELLLMAPLASVKMKDGMISRLDFAAPQGRLSVRPDVVIDATGDGVCARMCGVPVLPGDENGITMAPVLRLFLDSVDLSEFEKDGIGRFSLNSGIFEELRTEKAAQGKVLATLVRRERFSGDLSFSELSMIQKTVREDVREGLRLIRETVPGLSLAEPVFYPMQYLLPEGPHPVGCHVLSEEEVRQGTVFEDWAVGRMLPAGSTEEDGTCTIPYGSFITHEARNLLLAGRSLSMESGAFSLLRGLPFSLATGCAAGCAAVLSLGSGGKVRKTDRTLLQRALSELGMAVPEFPAKTV